MARRLRKSVDDVSLYDIEDLTNFEDLESLLDTNPLELGLSDQLFFGYLNYFSKSFFYVLSQLVFSRYYSFFSLFFRASCGTNLFILFCVHWKERLRWGDNGGLSPDGFLMGSLNALRLSEIQKLGLSYSFYNKNFFYSYKFKKALPFFRRSCAWFSLGTYNFYKSFIDYIFYFKHNESIGISAYFSPKLRIALIHRPRFRWQPSQVSLLRYSRKTLWPRPQRSFSAHLESFLLSIYYSKLKLILLVRLFNVQSGSDDGEDWSLAYSMRNKAFRPLVILRELSDLWDEDSFLFGYFYLRIFIFAVKFVVMLPKMLYFMKLRYSYFFNLISVVFSHGYLSTIIYKEFWRVFERKFFIWYINGKYWRNSMFFSTFLVDKVVEHGDIFRDRVFFSYPIVHLPEDNCQSHYEGSLRMGHLDTLDFLVREVFKGGYRIYDSSPGWRVESEDNYTSYLLGGIFGNFRVMKAVLIEFYYDVARDLMAAGRLDRLGGEVKPPVVYDDFDSVYEEAYAVAFKFLEGRLVNYSYEKEKFERKYKIYEDYFNEFAQLEGSVDLRESYAFKDTLLSPVNFSDFFLDLDISFSYMRKFFSFWHYFSFGVLDKFFCHSLTLYAVFERVFIDDYFLGCFIDTVSNIFDGFVLAEGRTEAESFLDFGALLGLRDIFFGLVKCYDFLFFFVFFSMPGFSVRRLRVCFFRAEFIKLMDFYDTGNFYPFAKHIVIPRKLNLFYNPYLIK